MTRPDQSHPPDPGDDLPPRPEEEIADAGRAAPTGPDDDVSAPGASGPVPERRGRMPDYPPSPRPLDGSITSPSPEIADPGYRPPDYPTEDAGPEQTEQN
ncbi:hypothetical protein [Pseudactinotalea sp. Z1748]|uniref:hypothetical protein n=1 Tax=Pseudactinotalea sp. Z1748 TaxID=3413027 RepID=UPI003C7CFAA8